MSTASISRSPAPFEIASPTRRSSEKAEQAFTLPPPEPVSTNGPRPRLDDERAASRADRTDHTAAARRERTRETAAADRSDSADESDKAETAAAADAGKEAAGQTEAGEGAPTEKASAGDESKDDNGESEAKEAGAGEQPAPATVEERKARLAAALEGAPVVGQGTPETAAAAGAVTQPAAPVEIGAEFLALAAIALQAGGPAKPETAAGQDGEAVAATDEAAAAIQTAGNAVPPPVQPAAPARADGQASAGGEAAAAEIKAGLKAQPPTALPTEAGKGAEADAKQGKDAEATTAAPAEVKSSDPVAAADQAKPAGEAKSGDTPQPSAPLSPQAILAAGPQTLTRPQAPLTELDAAAQATAQAQAEATAKATSAESTRPTPLHIVPIEIGAKALAGNRRFDIRLDPAELGRVDVSLEISGKGEVSAKLTVDRVETLQLLQRDARTLERAFEQAGLKPSEGGVEMSLRDSSDQSGSRQNRQDEEGARSRRAWVETSEESALVAETAPLRRNGRLGGVDLSI